MPIYSHTVPALAPDATVFGFYWEMTHDRSGDVVGTGFCRDQWPQLRPQSGYSYRVVKLLAAPADKECTPCPR
ncbi:MAG TPA: hypothetical protein VN201_07975 [Roseateles sp.]|nr:hypothetical protein [Roseateles sp.]